MSGNVENSHHILYGLAGVSAPSVPDTDQFPLTLPDTRVRRSTFQSDPAKSNAFPSFAIAVSGHHLIVAVMFLTCVDYCAG